MMAAGDSAIVVAALSKRFAGVVAVDRLSFTVAPGEIFGLVGPDGAGKTTVLRILAGVLPADGGRVLVAGQDVVETSEGVKSYISYMPQRFGLYEDLTVEENIRFYADLYGLRRAERKAAVSRLLRAAGMSEFQRRLAGKLSGGMKQKLGLVCALVHQPRVLLLDEPTTGVDPVSRREFWTILYSMQAQGVTILVSTAYLDEAERCHRVGLLYEGRMLLCDTPAALKSGMPGAVLALRAEDPRRLGTTLAGAEGVLNLLVVGDGVRLVVDEPQRRIRELSERARAAGLKILKIVQVAPSVEDLFVSAVQSQARRAP